ncbi:MAG TPA: hypothetical protein VNH82_11585 [Candidatus Dormibacteraeota bacterium]|nr:hypothetical protein [Candidatus Dormibacteraeota bacterium]HVC24045.1 hypothetical protein [Candidatus Dormibacteraeota bacterium]
MDHGDGTEEVTIAAECLKDGPGCPKQHQIGHECSPAGPEAQVAKAWEWPPGAKRAHPLPDRHRPSRSARKVCQEAVQFPTRLGSEGEAGALAELFCAEPTLDMVLLEFHDDLLPVYVGSPQLIAMRPRRPAAPAR